MTSPTFLLAAAVPIAITASACSAPAPSTEQIAEAAANGSGVWIWVEADSDTLRSLSDEARDRNWIATIEGDRVQIKPVAADAAALTSFLNDIRSGKFGKLSSTSVGFISEPPTPKQ